MDFLGKRILASSLIMSFSSMECSDLLLLMDSKSNWGLVEVLGGCFPIFVEHLSGVLIASVVLLGPKSCGFEDYVDSASPDSYSLLDDSISSSIKVRPFFDRVLQRWL